MPRTGFEDTFHRFAPRKAAAGLMAAAVMLSACSPAAAPPASTPGGSQAAGSAAAATCALGTDPDAALAKLSSTVLATGPFGEKPASPDRRHADGR